MLNFVDYWVESLNLIINNFYEYATTSFLRMCEMWNFNQGVSHKQGSPLLFLVLLIQPFFLLLLLQMVRFDRANRLLANQQWQHGH